MVAVPLPVGFEDRLDLIKEILIDDRIVLARVALTAMVDLAKIGSIAQEGDQRSQHERNATNGASGCETTRPRHKPALAQVAL